MLNSMKKQVIYLQSGIKRPILILCLHEFKSMCISGTWSQHKTLHKGMDYLSQRSELYR